MMKRVFLTSGFGMLLSLAFAILLPIVPAAGQALDAETLKQISELKALQSRECLKKGDRRCAISKALEGLPKHFTEQDIKERPAAYEALYRAVNSRSLRLPIKLGPVHASFDNQGTRVATVSQNVGSVDREALKLWDAKTGALIKELLPPERSGTVGATLGSLVFSTDGRLAMHLDPVLQRPIIWDAETGKQLRELPNVPGPGGQMVVPPSIAFSAKATYAFASGVAGLRVYDVATGKVVWNHKGLMAAAISPDERFVATGLQQDSKGGGEYQTIRFELFEFASNLRVGRLDIKEPTWGVYSVAFSDDGSKVALTTSSDALILVDTALRTFKRISVARQGIGNVRFSPDGRYVATSSGDASDRTPIVFDVETGERVTLPLEEQPFYDTVFNAIGELVGEPAFPVAGDIWRKGTAGPALYDKAIAELGQGQ